MLKLISQFDNKKTRVSASTPTCAACSSCCCCCIITTIATSILTTRSIGSVARENNKELETGQAVGIFLAVLIFLIISIIAFFSLIISIGYGTLILLILAPLYLLLLGFLLRKLKNNYETIFFILIFFVIFMVIEFNAWLKIIN